MTLMGLEWRKLTINSDEYDPLGTAVAKIDDKK